MVESSAAVVSAAKLRDLRLARRMTLKEVGDELSVSPQAISRYEQGKSRVPSDALPVLARVFSVEIGDLYDSPVRLPRNLRTDQQRAEVLESGQTIRQYVDERLGRRVDEMPSAERQFLDEVLSAYLRFRAQVFGDEGMQEVHAGA